MPGKERTERRRIQRAEGCRCRFSPLTMMFGMVAEAEKRGVRYEGGGVVK